MSTVLGLGAPTLVGPILTAFITSGESELTGILDVILDSAASFGVGQRPTTNGHMSNPFPRLLVATGHCPEAAKEQAQNLHKYCQSHKISLVDLSHTLGVRREHLSYRTFAVTNGSQKPMFSAPIKSAKHPPEVVFVFTGQSAQWATMAASLISGIPSVSADVDSMEDALSLLDEPPSWSIRGETVLPIKAVVAARLTGAHRGANEDGRRQSS